MDARTDPSTTDVSCGASPDATARREAEDALQASEVRYRTLLESIDEGFCVIEVLFEEGQGEGEDGPPRPVDYRFLEMNPAFVAQTGFADAVGRRMRELAPAHESYWYEVYGRVALTGEPARFEAAAAALGRWYDVDAFRVGAPHELRVAVLFKDISARKRADAERERLLAEARAAREAVEQERRRLETLLDHLPVGVTFAEAPSGRLLVSNEAVRRIWGLDTPAARVADYSDLYVGYVPGTDQPYESDAWPLARALRRGEIVVEEVVEIAQPDATRRLVSISAAPVRDAAGAVVGGVVMSQDVDERERLRASERAARERAERLQALTATLAATTTPEEVAEVVVAQGVAATGASSAVLALRTAPPSSEGSGEAALVRAHGVSALVRAEFTRFPLAAPTPVGLCLREGVPTFVEDGAALRAAFPGAIALFDSMGTHSLAAVPLQVAGEVVGAMSFSWATPRALPEDDQAFFVALGRQAAQALERARLLAAEREVRAQAERARAEAEAARERTARLLALTAALSTASTPDEVADAAVRHATAALGAAGTVFARLAADGEALEIMQAGDMPADARVAWHRFPVSTPAPLSDAVRHAEPIYLASRAEWAERYPHLLPTLDAAGHQANAVLPIMLDGRVLGVLGAAFVVARAFDAEDRALALAVAQQCAQALERARLFEAERAARHEAEAANRAKSEFLAVMSHELRTPLNAIGGYAELMDMGIRGPVTTQQREDLRRLQASQRHLLGLINEVLNYAKLETGAVHYDLVSVRVRDALVGAEALVAPQAAAKGLTLSVAACPPDLAVRADVEKLRQILVNLLSNAVKFTERGGQVELACAAAGEHARVAVRDTGIGIAADQLERIFEPFVQVRADLTRPHEGTGLGLAISRDLARGMGGDLTAESTLDAGSVFTLSLPRAHAYPNG